VIRPVGSWQAEAVLGALHQRRGGGLELAVDPIGKVSAQRRRSTNPGDGEAQRAQREQRRDQPEAQRHHCR